MRSLITFLALLFLMSTGASANVVTVRWATWGPEHVDKQLIEAFEKEHPHIKIEYIGSAYGEHHEKMKLLSAAGAGADIYVVDGYYLPEFSQIGLIQPIDELLARESEFSLDEYFPPTLADVQYQDKTYGLPYISGPIYLTYNATHLESAGLGRPDLNWDRDTYFEYARKLTVTDGDRVVRAGTEDYFQWTRFWSWVWGAGGDAFDVENGKFLLTTREALDGLEFMDQMRELGFSTPGKVSNQRVSMSADYPNNFSFVRGEEWPFEWDVTLFPGGPQGQYQIWKGNVMAMSSTTAVRDEAWTFLKFLLSPKGRGHEIYVANRRFQPQSRDPHIWALWDEARGSHEAASLQEISMLAATDYGRALPQLLNWSDVVGHIGRAFSLIRRGVIPPSVAMEQIRGPIENLLQSEPSRRALNQ